MKINQIPSVKPFQIRVSNRETLKVNYKNPAAIKASITDTNGQKTKIENENLPKTLRTLNDSHKISAFLEHAAFKVARFTDGGYNVYVHVRGLGGMNNNATAPVSAGTTTITEEVIGLNENEVAAIRREMGLIRATIPERLDDIRARYGDAVANDQEAVAFLQALHRSGQEWLGIQERMQAYIGSVVGHAMTMAECFRAVREEIFPQFRGVTPEIKDALKQQLLDALAVLRTEMENHQMGARAVLDEVTVFQQRFEGFSQTLETLSGRYEALKVKLEQEIEGLNNRLEKLNTDLNRVQQKLGKVGQVSDGLKALSGVVAAKDPVVGAVLSGAAIVFGFFEGRQRHRLEAEERRILEQIEAAQRRIAEAKQEERDTESFLNDVGIIRDSVRNIARHADSLRGFWAGVVDDFTNVIMALSKAGGTDNSLLIGVHCQSAKRLWEDVLTKLQTFRQNAFER